MAPLNKQSVALNFAQGLDTKTDPYQVDLGRFLELENGIFLKGKALTKRNGFGALTALSDTSSTYLTTFDQDLTAIGKSINAYASESQRWYNKGTLQPIQLDTLSLIRNNLNQSSIDTAFSANGLTCVVYSEQNPSSLSATIYKYAILDSATGQNVVAPIQISGADATHGVPRVFSLPFYFIIVYTRKVSSTYYIDYISVPIVRPNQPNAPINITGDYSPTLSQPAFNGVVVADGLWIVWNSVSSGVLVRGLNSGLLFSSVGLVDGAHNAQMVSVMQTGVRNPFDQPNSIIVYYYDGSSIWQTEIVLTYPNFIFAFTPTLIAINSVSNITAGSDGLCVYAEIINAYSYNSGIPTNYIYKYTSTTANVVIRSVGLASKCITYEGNDYFLSIYESPFQSTYFLINATTRQVVGKLAYQNAGSYITKVLPSVSLIGSQISMGYLLKDLVRSVNKDTNINATQVGGVYSQTGINLATFDLNPSQIQSVEIGANLNIPSAINWAYDGYQATEQEFFLYPDSVETASSTTGGSVGDGTYYYVATYEWTDNQGNYFRSAPSIPALCTSSGGNTSTNTINVPTLRLTYKTNVTLNVYRWSAAQQVYYLINATSYLAQVLNDPTLDSIAIIDTAADADIIGNTILYTTGGVVENIGPPALRNMFIFDDRLFGIAAEDPNLLLFSKQVIESTPVEMSDLLSIYVNPNVGAQGPTGSMTCGFPMDDKAVLFKASAINYIAGTGPDNTGANSQYTQPVFITSTVGCSNANSVVFQPQGLMFEFASEAGNQIWLLGRDLSTQYIGAPVEAFTQSATVKSVVNIPGTNQVRFTLSTGVTLMYDYYYQQWGTFKNVPAISSTLFQGLHTYLDQFGRIFQETPGKYLDGSSPVLMKFKTSWITLQALQGYQRAYYFTLLGTYYSPHLLNVGVAYSYNPAIQSTALIRPVNFAPAYGVDTPYGQGSPYGGPPSVEQWRVWLQQQRCQSVQVTVQEYFDATYGTQAGQGLTLSGMNFLIGTKGQARPYKAATSVGAE